MCGIAGFLASGEAYSAANRQAPALQQAIRYRGRDAEGEWADQVRVHLLHSRLTVIDAASGGQPMASGDGRFVIVFNGEIYNYTELRLDYARAGASFRTNSDTEVILEGYRLKGAEVCRDLNGMFAFAIWDRDAKTLFLARDRLGKKPLFWTELGGALFFASTLDAFTRLPGWDARLSPAALGLYSLLGAFPGEATIYANANALPAASWAMISPTALRPQPSRYWRMQFPASKRGNLASHLVEYEELLTDAVRIRLRSDVPVALTFSGGVDSGSIAAVASKRLGADLSCFTVDYHTEDDPSEETINAQRAARQLGLDWHYIHFDYHTRLLDDLSEAYSNYDQPNQQMALAYSHHLYQAIKPHATVVLSGNGADELFTGYVGDERIRRRDVAMTIARPLRPLLRHFSDSRFLRFDIPQAYVESVMLEAGQASFDPAVVDAIRPHVVALGEEMAKSGVASMMDLKMWTALNFSTVDANYRVPDVSGLAAQVEVRSPFLDYRMVEFAARLPHRYKVANLFSAGANKYLPKRYYQRWMPADIVWSRKKGMGWNLRWDRSIASDPSFEAAFADAYAKLDERGIPSAQFRSAWRRYVDDLRCGIESPSTAGVMMNGFMLGKWFERQRDNHGLQAP
jgi:asparagine synthase (glutamine-hydrolysing)